MEPWQSWGVVLLTGGAIYYYYTHRDGSQGRVGRAASISEPAQMKAGRRRSANRGNKKRRGSAGMMEPSSSDVAETSALASGAPVSSNETPKKRKGSKKEAQSYPVTENESKVDRPTAAVDDEERDLEMSNKEFARQLSGLKTGTLTSSSTPASNKTKKQSRLQATAQNGQPSSTAEPSVAVSTTSSTTGADADDDLSPVNSPQFGASNAVDSRTSGDISDMLEKPGAGPSVLRLTEPTNPLPNRVKKSSNQQDFQVKETKKQRQNRRKAEEAKAQREQAEKERRVLLEKQLRTAREARGEPSKNGLGTSKPPVTNAWNSAPKSTGQAPVSSTSALSDKVNGSLLDTFEPQEQSHVQDVSDVTSISDHKINGTPSTAPSSVWERDLPSEEEQMRILNEMNDDAGWNTVSKSKKGKKKGVVAADDGAGKESNDASLAKSSKPIVTASANAPVGTTATKKAPSQNENIPMDPVWAANANVTDSDWAVV